MAYFPLFVDLKGQNGLIVGGGRVALRKIEKLLPYEPHLTVIAPEILPEIAAFPGVRVICRGFAPADVEADWAFAVAASDERAQNHRVAALCRERKILVNVVDTPDDCTFLFPALIQSGPLSIGISTGGASPTAAVWLKEQIAARLPERFEEILIWLGRQRVTLKQRIPEEAARAAALQTLFFACLERARPLTGKEAAAVVEENRDGQ